MSDLTHSPAVQVPGGMIEQLAQNFSIKLHAADTTLVEYPHTTTWRVLPSLTLALTENAGRIEFEDRIVRLKAGQAFAIAPGVRHCITKTSRRAGYSYWAHFQCEIFAGVSLFSLVEPPLIFNGVLAQRMGKICDELGKLMRAPATLETLLRQQAFGWELVAALLSTGSSWDEHRERIRRWSRLTPVLGHVEANLARPIAHGELARIAGLSPSRFHVVFRSAFGCAPYEYVQRARLKKAQELLLHSDHSIAEIAGKDGHPDPYHFSRTFRSKIGLSPLQYRQQMERSFF